MDFDPTRLFTKHNRDKVNPGEKGLFIDCLEELMMMLEEDDPSMYAHKVARVAKPEEADEVVFISEREYGFSKWGCPIFSEMFYKLD